MQVADLWAVGCAEPGGGCCYGLVAFPEHEDAVGVEVVLVLTHAPVEEAVAVLALECFTYYLFPRALVRGLEYAETVGFGDLHRGQVLQGGPAHYYQRIQD